MKVDLMTLVGVKSQADGDNPKGRASYATKHKRDLEKIAKLMKAHPEEEIYYGHNWVRIAGCSFNGVTKENLQKYLQTLKY